MKNKLVFENPLNPNTNQWSKHAVASGLLYTWDKSEIATRDRYSWNRYTKTVINGDTYVWQKSELITNTYLYALFDKELSRRPESWCYGWNVYSDSTKNEFLYTIKSGGQDGSLYPENGSAFAIGGLKWFERYVYYTNNYNSICYYTYNYPPFDSNDYPVNNITLYYAYNKPTFNKDTGKFNMTGATAAVGSASNELLQSLYSQLRKYVAFGSDGIIDYYYELTERSYIVDNGDGHFDISHAIRYNSREITADYSYNYTGFRRLSDTLDSDALYQTLNGTTGYVETHAGNEIGEITSLLRDEYPDAGAQNGYYYKYLRTIPAPEGTPGTTTVKDKYIGKEYAYTDDAYPTDGVSGDYYYEYIGMELEEYAGDFIEQVITPKETSYPISGSQDGYYYTYITSSTEQYAGEFIDFVVDISSTKYPQNGMQGSYWYIYTGNAIADIYTLTDSDIIGGVKYKEDVNPDTDYVIGSAVAAQISFTINNQDGTASKYVGKTCRYYTMQGNEAEWKLMGKFIINSCDEKTKMTAELKGYDNISKFDIYVDSWINSLTYPITLSEMFRSLCTYCGSTFNISTFTNSNFEVKDNFTAVNITGRQILQYIAQAAAGFATAKPDGTITIRNYVATGTTLDNSKYTKLKNATYSTKAITKLTVQKTSDDLGVSSGSGDIVYKITNNPLLYSEDDVSIQEEVNNIFDVIKTVSYIPATIELLQDFNINCGDIITVDGLNVYVMSKELTSSGVKIACTGNKEREATGEETNTDIVALRGKTNELTREISQTQSTITDTAAQLQSQITQTADTINSTISSQGEIITQIQQNLDGISLTYNSSAGTASITIGNVTVSNLVDGNYVDEVVAGIDLTGYVTFNSLSGSGTSTINGDNITTGTISANRLNLTGAISWGDLSNDAKSNIIQYAEDAGAAASGVPSYIKNTYIDSTTIYSPTIYGAEIYAGSSTDGYIKLASTGFNFNSKSNGSLIGLGYYAGNYNYPYMVLGGGVDSAGTDRGMIKKYSNGIWIGDSDNMSSSTPGGTGIFINFNTHKFYKYVNGTATQF